MHRPPGQGEGNEGGDGDQSQEIFGEHADDAAGAGAQYFWDTDLPDQLLGRISCHAQQTDTGDTDGQHGKHGGNPLYGLFGPVLFGWWLVDELIIERTFGNEF